MMQRSVLVKTSCGCAMPGVAAALWRERFEKAAEAQLAKGRRRPVRTKVARYVDLHAPGLSRKLAAILQRHSRTIATKIVAKLPRKAHKAVDPEDLSDFADEAIDALDLMGLAEELGIEDMVTDLVAAVTAEAVTAYKRAALVGVSEVMISQPPQHATTRDATRAGVGAMTDQIDEAAIAFAQQRGGELIKDLAGTTEQDLKDFLGESIAAGMSPQALSDAIQELGAFSASRGDMISRTELAFAHVSGNVDGWRQTGLVDKKESILGDLHEIDDECDDCAEAGAVPLDDDFVEGYSFPPYHPNCVCDVMPIVADDEGE